MEGLLLLPQPQPGLSASSCTSPPVQNKPVAAKKERSEKKEKQDEGGKKKSGLIGGNLSKFIGKVIRRSFLTTRRTESS